MWLKNWTEILPIVAGLCFGVSFVQTDVPTAQFTGPTTSDFIGSNVVKASMSIFPNANGTTITVTPADKPAPARITRIEPDYGPSSGGTKFRIYGRDMTCSQNRIRVQLIYGDVQLTAQSCATEIDAITCITPSSKPLETGEFEVQVTCESENGTNWKTNDSVVFTYKPDPTIDNVFPMESILAGGITQTVVGTNLDSVAHPQMWTGYDQPSSGQGEPCFLWNSTLLRCRTQPVSVSSSSSNDSVRTHPEEINSNGGKVSIGFFLDGVKVQQFAPLRMFHNPEIERFNPETKIHQANGNNVLNIGVTWPQMNFTADDLKVQVGLRSCTGIHSNSSSIICYPPPLPKSVIRYGPAELNTLEVTASVGHVTRDVGRLHYTSLEPFHVVMSVMIAVLAFIFVVSCGFGCCTFFGPRVDTSCGAKKKSRFRPMSADAFEPTLDDSGSSRKDGSGMTEAGKRRGKRSGTKAPERDGGDGQIECVAMQYRGDGREPQ